MKILEKLWFLYKLEGEPKNLSIESFCMQQGVSYNAFYKWFSNRKKTIVPVEIIGMSQAEASCQISDPEIRPLTTASVPSCTPIDSVSIRTMTIERKNKIAFGSHQSVETSAVYHTFIATCKMSALSFYQFLKNYFTAFMKGRTDFENLTPAILGKIN